SGVLGIRQKGCVCQFGPAPVAGGNVTAAHSYFADCAESDSFTLLVEQKDIHIFDGVANRCHFGYAFSLLVEKILPHNAGLCSPQSDVQKAIVVKVPLK